MAGIRVGVQIQQQHATYQQLRRVWHQRDCDDYLAAGITHLIGETSGPDYDLAPLHTLIAWRDRHTIGQ